MNHDVKGTSNDQHQKSWIYIEEIDSTWDCVYVTNQQMHIGKQFVEPDSSIRL